GADTGRQLTDEGVEVLALERATENEAERRVVCRDTAAGRGGVRRLRVVDPADAAELAHQLQPVRDAGERTECLRDRVVRHAEGAGGCRRSGGVLPVVTAWNEGLRRQPVVGAELDPVDSEAARHDLRACPLEDAELRGAVRGEAAVP